MERFFKYLSITYNALLWAISSCYISFFCFEGLGVYIFAGTFAVVLAFLMFCERHDSRGIGWEGTVFSLMVLISCAAIFGGLTTYALTIPALVLGLTFPEIVLDAVFIIAVPVLAYEILFPKRNCSHGDKGQMIAETYARHVRWVCVGVLFVLIMVCSLVPAIRVKMSEFFGLMAMLDINGIVELIRSYGPWGGVISCLLMILQSLAAPIPAYLLTISNAIVYGWVFGSILSWTSAMLAASICFWIARSMGREAVARFVTSGMLARIDKFFVKYGKNAVLILRLLPFMSFDYVSYAAGLTGMSFLDFLIATGVGQLPATVLYSLLADLFVGTSYYLVYVLLAIFAVAALIFLIRAIFMAKNKDLA